ncbi:MAG TPA: hypothetical protein VJS90_12765 [Pseudomonas sp.]|uniref:hypothetical protein n=1 Tax=Pseudomonas sp. TaxID=306 RepID=UPI002B4933A6|nr:hypothetical protein [Pseudomonas sp.]HKS13898.1 hypothetical protein [Pseudomonas sp.]
MARANSNGSKTPEAIAASPPGDMEPGSAALTGSSTPDDAQITIYPIRSYLDGKEIRRAGGEGYKSPKHDAVSLIAAGLATDKDPKA